MSGRGIVEAELFRTEQVSRLARTSDPTSPAKGDAWIRTDVQPVTDSVAALRIQGDAGVLEAPLFDPSATTGSDVYVGKRFLFADGTEGHLLVTDQGGAVGSPRVVTSSGTLYEAHDSLEVNAIPDSVVDNFEDDPAGVYATGDTISNYYRGDTGDFSRTTTDAAEGSKALSDNATSSRQYIWSIPGDGLPNYPGEGNTIRSLMRDAGNAPVFLFGVNAATNGFNGYGVEINTGIDAFNIYRYDDETGDGAGAGETKLVGGSPSIGQNTWYWIEVRAPTSGDNSLTADLYNVNTGDSPPTRGSLIDGLSTSDSTHTGNRGIGLYRRAGTSTSAATLDWIGDLNA